MLAIEPNILNIDVSVGSSIILQIKFVLLKEWTTFSLGFGIGP